MVRCTFSCSSTEDAAGYGLLSNRETKLVDDTGNEYFANKIQIGKKAAGENGDIHVPLTKGSRYTTKLFDI